MVHFLVSVGFGALIYAGAVGRDVHPSVPASRAPTCDTTYVGPPGGSVYNELNWTEGLPRPGDVACFPDDQRRVGSANPPDSGGLVSAGRITEVRIIPSTRELTGGSNDPPYGAARDYQSSSPPLKRWATPPNPPPPTATGSCCLDSTCIVSDAFDCRELGGYFLEGVGPCTEYVCATGACCKQGAECVDDDGGGGSMDQELCDTMAGSYLGGAHCASDPCQRFRIPYGFEIVEVAPGTEVLVRWYPRLNNCGQIVFHMVLETPMGLRSDVFHYDNGLLTEVTNSDDVSDIFPDINDHGTIVWGRGAPPAGSEVVMLRDGDISVLEMAPGPLSPRINNLDHVVWDVHTPEPCTVSAYKCDIYFYDGNTIEKIYEDGYSNQSVCINDHDQMAWTRYIFPCGGGVPDWTSQIVLYTGGPPLPLPSESDTPQIPDLNIGPRVAWDASPHGLELWQDGVTTTVLEANTSAPALNDRGDITYGFKTTYTPWQTWLYDHVEFIRISNDMDIENLIDNGRPGINDAGEIAWWWKPNGGFTPSGTRFMRRIRNGDVDFDGDRDLDDFIPLPNCWTGPVPTDGLCECRFLDIDHDRDIDYDDFDLFMRVYTGPLEDCNENEIIDLYDLIDGPSQDCNLNGIPDECDLSSGTSQDIDGDGLLDECCMPSAPAHGDTLGAKNRYLSFTTSDSHQTQAIRVTFTDLPPSFEGLEGQSMWVGQPREYCENSGQGRNTPPEDCAPVAGRIWSTFTAATLQCQPYYTDWSEVGTVYVYHAAIVPGGTYHLQAIKEGCGMAWEGNYSAALIAGTSIWGDVVKDCATFPCGPPDGTVGIPTDVTAMLDKFRNSGPPSVANAAILKVRADIEPQVPDLLINISDITFCLDAFRGFDYPFPAPPSPPCP